MIGSKRCSRCREVKPLSAFVRDRTKASGYAYACGACRAAAKRAARRTEPYRFRRRIADAASRERAEWRRWRRRLRDGVLFRDPGWEWSHAKPCAGKHSRCGELKPLSAFESAGGGKRVAYCKPCGNVALRDKYRLRWQRRRAREAGAPGRRTVEQTRARFAFYGDRCAYCGAEGELVVEHVIPLSRGGSEWPANIRPACPTCNAEKGIATLSEWLEAA